MKNKILKNVLILLILFLGIVAIIIPKELLELDEVWNYNFARNVADGLIPYKDFNMVQTPLLPLICGLILKLTFNELIVMRIIATLLILAILYVTYKIFESLKINTRIVNLLITFFFLFLTPYFCIDYNFAVLLLILITIYYEINSLLIKKDILSVNKKDFLIGILVGTSILFKQTTGIFFSLIFIFYKLVIVTNKNEIKKLLKIIFIRSLGVLIPIAIFAVYLTVNNIWNDFLDYTIYSLNTFTNKVSYINLIKGEYGIVIAILSVLIPITIIAMYFIWAYKKNKTEEQKNMLILFSYCVAAFIVVYPISDGFHFIIGSFPALIGFAYLIYLILKNIIKERKMINKIGKILQNITYTLVIIIIIYSIFVLGQYLSNCNQYKELEHFKYIPLESENIKKIDEFIIEKKETIFILDATAALYMIPINRYTKDYDMLLKGNLGKKDVTGIIKDLETKEPGTIVLIMNEHYERNWQNPEEIKKYIVNNWIKIGQIENFDIYLKY